MRTVFCILVLIFCVNSFGYSQTEVEEREIFVVAEVMPEFPGGVDAFKNYLEINARISIAYPPKRRRRSNVQSPYAISFTIEDDGSISDVKVRTTDDKFSIESETENMVIRVLQEMPKWTPAKQRNRPVTFQYFLRIRFLDR